MGAIGYEKKFGLLQFMQSVTKQICMTGKPYTPDEDEVLVTATAWHNQGPGTSWPPHFALYDITDSVQSGSLVWQWDMTDVESGWYTELIPKAQQFTLTAGTTYALGIKCDNNWWAVGPAGGVATSHYQSNTYAGNSDFPSTFDGTTPLVNPRTAYVSTVRKVAPRVSVLESY